MVDEIPTRPPATTPQAAQNRLISLAYEVAEQRLIAGTASAQEITYLLKLGDQDTAQERMKKDQEIALLTARVESLANSGHQEELYKKAMAAFSDYSGKSLDEDEIY